MKVLYQRISKYISIEKNNTKNIRIYLYQKNNTNEYPNIFLSKKWYEHIDEYICIKEKVTNEYSNIFATENIQIYLYNCVKFLYKQIFKNAF